MTDDDVYNKKERYMYKHWGLSGEPDNLKMTGDNLQLDFERIRILYSSTRGITIGLLALTLFVVLFMSAYLPLQLVGIWAAAALASMVPRMIVVQRFRRGIQSLQITPENVLPWERYWITTIIPFMLAFASLAFLPFNDNEALLAVTLFLVLLCTGSVLTSNTSLKSLTVSNTIILLPLLIRLLLEQTPLFTILACFFVVAIVIFRNYTIRVNRTLMENIQLKIDNKNISLTDPLTNLWNRRGLHFFVEKLIPRSLRSSEPFTIVMLDIDHFKKFNDTHGHNAGDVELAKVATCIEQETRDGDLVVRYGGEEFVVVLPATNMDQTREVAERILGNVRTNTGVTMSGGLAIYAPDNSPKLDFRNLIHEADEALYAAKAAGRDRIVTAEQPCYTNQQQTSPLGLG